MLKRTVALPPVGHVHANAGVIGLCFVLNYVLSGELAGFNKCAAQKCDESVDLLFHAHGAQAYSYNSTENLLEKKTLIMLSDFFFFSFFFLSFPPGVSKLTYPVGISFTSGKLVIPQPCPAANILDHSHSSYLRAVARPPGLQTPFVCNVSLKHASNTLGNHVIARVTQAEKKRKKKKKGKTLPPART
jgi:hypothetical protein